MLAMMEQRAEAGVAKRLRMAGALNRHGRLLYFYGLGLSLAASSDTPDEYRFEVTLLSQYQEDFSSYTLKRFMEDYVRVFRREEAAEAESEVEDEDEEEKAERAREAVNHARILRLQEQFSLIKVKVLLVSLLNGFRDLTLSGLQVVDSFIDPRDEMRSEI